MTNFELFLQGNAEMLIVTAALILTLAIFHFLFACYRGIRTWWSTEAFRL